MAEYGGSDGTLAFVRDVVLPQARQHLDLVDLAAQPGAFGVMGASMGGLMALVAGLRLPHIFGQVLSQSGAFHLGDYATVALDLVQHLPVRPLRIWMDVGRYEWLLESNRAHAGAAARPRLRRDLSRIQRRAQLQRLAQRPVARTGGAFPMERILITGANRGIGLEPACGIITLADGLLPEQTSKFLTWDGREHAW